MLSVGGDNVPVVVSAPFDCKDGNLLPDIFVSDGALVCGGEEYPIVKSSQLHAMAPDALCFVLLQYADLSEQTVARLKELKNYVIVAESYHDNPVGELRAIVHTLSLAGIDAPVIMRRNYQKESVESLRIKAAADLGVLLIDGIADGIWIENDVSPAVDINNIAFGILQATRRRISKTEYIACPGCGRTMYDLQGTLAKIKAATAHLKGLKIGVMGCIVNGPGEMADADYGYVGAARGKVSLYRRKECVEKNIPEEEAIARLLALIESDKNKN